MSPRINLHGREQTDNFFSISDLPHRTQKQLSMSNQRFEKGSFCTSAKT
jgi:hypothetical protein